MVKFFYPPPEKKQVNTNVKAYMSTIMAAFLWGTSFIIVELGLEIINAIWFAFLRFLIASTGSLIIILILRKRIDRTLLFGRWIWLLGLFNALGFVGQFVGQTMTNATKTAFLINLNLVTVAILSAIFLNERFNKQKGFAVILAVIGVFFLTTNGDISKIVTGEFVGDMFALAGGLSWAFYIVTNKKIISQPGTEPVALTVCVMFSTTICMLPIAIIFGGINYSILTIGVEGLSYIIYLGIFCNIIPFMLWIFGLKYLSATSSTILLLIEVLVAVVLAMIILNEFLSIVGIFGGVFILLAILLINYKSK